MQKYEFTNNKKSGLTQIRALRDIPKYGVKRGDLGGFLEKESNLSQDGDAWVHGDARVHDNARVHGDAWVFGNARVYGNSRVYGDAQVYDNVLVHGDAWICGDAQVYGDAKETGKTLVLIGTKHPITVTQNYTFVGCEKQKHGKSWVAIGKKHKWKAIEIRKYCSIIKTLESLRKKK